MSIQKVAPAILRIIYLNPNKIKVTMVRYPFTLKEYYKKTKKNEYAKQIKQLIDKMHAEHILHYDLTPYNIVVNPETKDVRIIDFGESYYFEEVTKEVINQTNFFFKPKDSFKNLQDLIDFEYVMYTKYL